MDVAGDQILGGTSLFLGQESGKIWWLKKVQHLQKKYRCQWTLLRGEEPKWIFHSLGNILRPLELPPASLERVVPTERQVRTVLGDCISRAKVIPAQAPQYGHCALISDFLDLANFEHRRRRRSSIGHELDQGPTRRVEAAEPCVGNQDGPIYRQFTEKNLTADVHYASNKCESLGSGRQLILHRNPSATGRDFSPQSAEPRHFLLVLSPNRLLQHRI